MPSHRSAGIVVVVAALLVLAAVNIPYLRGCCRTYAWEQGAPLRVIRTMPPRLKSESSARLSWVGFNRLIKREESNDQIAYVKKEMYVYPVLNPDVAECR